MDNTTRNHPSDRRSATLGEAAPGELFADVLRVSPAPNPSREAFVTVVNVVLVGAILAVLQPEAPIAAGVAGVLVLFTAVRWIAGSRRWRAS